MKKISIFNDVLGPVMRGPSSSHTAGSYHIGKIACSLLGVKPEKAVFTFDPDGSYAKVYRQQGVDLAYAAAVMGWSITDDRFPEALNYASSQGYTIEFNVNKILGADHPNTVEIRMVSQKGYEITAVARSVGGGSVEFTRLEEWEVLINGNYYDVLIVCEKNTESFILERFAHDPEIVDSPVVKEQNDTVLIHVQRYSALKKDFRNYLESIPGVHNLWITEPVALIKMGVPLFSSADKMVSMAEKRGCSLGEIAIAYESQLLGLPETDIIAEMERRFGIMKESVAKGLEENPPPMLLLNPTAGKVYKAEAEGRVALGGLHTRAAARSMAAMHINNGMGIVCAAPTGGAAGVIPGVIVTLEEERGISAETIIKSLFSMSAVGLILAIRATFAAEVAGCQVEIGAAGAMAAAGVVEAAGGTPRQAAEAAAISFQNTMGSVCDLVQGIVEIPCHTRNAVSASGAFVCADLIMGGYENPVPLDETIDAVFESGKMLPAELRCTALGGLAVTPSALAMKRLR